MQFKIRIRNYQARKDKMMKRQLIGSFLVWLYMGLVPALAQADLIFDNFDSQSEYNHFSGNRGIWGSSSHYNISCDTSNARGGNGACLRLHYSVTPGRDGGIWNSVLGKANYNGYYLNFTDLYGRLKNSSGNPSNIENVKVTKISFYAKGDDGEDFDHKVRLELKKYSNSSWITIAEKLFIIPNKDGWTKYEWLVNEMGEVDLSQVKQIVFSFKYTDYGEAKSGNIFIDDITFTTDETAYDASTWSSDQFLDLVEHRAFSYFLRFTDSYGFALDRNAYSDQVSVGAIGFQLAAYCIGHKRGWADGLENRVETILQNLVNAPMGSDIDGSKAGYKGFFYHFLKANECRRKNTHTELSLYDTMLLMSGVLVVKEYFKNNSNIQTYAQSLYNAVEWDWMVDKESGDSKNLFRIAWWPETGFLHPIENKPVYMDDYTDEALLVDLLAIGSNTHPTTMETYNARARSMGRYPASSSIDIASSWTASLFTYFFASCWHDLKKLGADRHLTKPLNIWDNNKQAIIANRQFCIDHQDGTVWDLDDDFTTYGPNSWGLTACDSPSDSCCMSSNDYYAFGALPSRRKNEDSNRKAASIGTIALYGVGSSIMLLPDESISALRNFYSKPGLWCPLFGFVDAYSDDPHWFEEDVNGDLIARTANCFNGPWIHHIKVGINEGPMLLAIENYRTRMIWHLSFRNLNIRKGYKEVFGVAVNLTAPYFLLLD